MPRTFYHVDRGSDLERGQTLDLRQPDCLEAAEQRAVGAQHPGGLSHHGRHYCAQDLAGGAAEDLWDFACEAVFELSRAARFPDRPSRFRSFFGFRTRADADRFVDEFVDGEHTVWAVTAADAFAGDMGLVDATDYADGLRRADYYWRGETFRDDPLWELLLVPPVEVVARVDGEDAA